MKKYIIFKNPYILIEDVRKRYLPFFKEYAEKMPKFSFDSPVLGCPFIGNKKLRFSKKNENKPGVCEICYKKYDNYEEHIILPEHREYAADDRNYREVDLLIGEIASSSYIDDSQVSNTTGQFNSNISYDIVDDVEKFIDEYLSK